MRLSIVIANYNTGDYLRTCLDSIDEKFAGVEHETIVIDNASSDGSEEAARDRPRTTLITSDHNMGFGAACNAGTRMAGGDMILFLNPDTRIRSSDVGALLQRFEEQATAGALGCQNLKPDGTIQTSAYTFPTLFQVVARMFRLKRLLDIPGVRPLLAPFLKNRFGQFDPHDRARSVDYVTGAFMVVKRKAWETVGGFDERFFLFCEEIDWCRRLKNGGGEVLFDPSFEIEHYVGLSTETVKERALLERLKSYLLYFEKHHSRFNVRCLRLTFAIGLRFWMTFYLLMRNNELYETYRNVRHNLVL